MADDDGAEADVPPIKGMSAILRAFALCRGRMGPDAFHGYSLESSKVAASI